MGEMTVKGYAERRVERDVVEVILKFIGEGTTIPEAVQKSSDELEKFLRIFEENGIDSGVFKIIDNSTSKKYRSENKKMPYESKRAISIKMPMNSANVDSMMQYISNYQINVEILDTYQYSRKIELHKELLKEAVDDSRAKAEMIASCAGQRIKGIKSVNADFSSSDKHMVFDDLSDCFDIAPCSVSRARKLSAPIIKETEEVEVVWLIED